MKLHVCVVRLHYFTQPQFYDRRDHLSLPHHQTPRFLREAQASSALNHPNIVTIHEIDEVERNGERYSFIVMEYVEGRTLKEIAGECSVEEAIDIIMQIADALAQAHERGIVHRDVKPSNVIVTN